MTTKDTQNNTTPTAMPSNPPLVPGPPPKPNAEDSLKEKSDEELPQIDVTAHLINSPWVWIIATAIIVALLWGLLASEKERGETSPPKDTLKTKQSTVEATDEAKTTALPSNKHKVQQYTTGDTIKSTSINVKLAPIDDNVVGLGLSSKLQILKMGKKTILKLEQGSAAFRATAKEDSELAINVGQYVVSGTGAQFLVSNYKKGQLSVTVRDGDVLLVAGDERWTIESGEYFELAHDGWADRGEALPDVLVQVATLLTGAGADVEIPPIQGSGGYTRGGERNIPQGTKRPREDVNHWRQLIKEGRYDEARTGLEQYLTKAAKDGGAWMLLAECQHRNGLWVEAVKSYEKAMDFAASSKAAKATFLAATIIHNNLGDYWRAASMFQDFLDSEKGSPQLRDVARVNMARSLLEIEQKEKAVGLLQTVLKNQNDPFVKANAKRMLGRIK